MSAFADLKKNAEKLNESLTDSFKDQREKKADDRFWYPATDKAGNATATVRFLPAPAGEDLPYVTLYRNAFKDEKTGRWYIENNLRTLGQQDPTDEYNRELWNTGTEENQKLYRHQKAKAEYFTNVYIIKDSTNPENEGQVKIFKFGPWMYKFIKSAMIPEFEDQEPIPVFDLWKGADFKIRIGKKGEHRNYDRSEWASPSEFMGGDDAKLEEIWLQANSLKEFIDPKNFKTYDELKKRFYNVIGLDGGTTVRSKAEAIPSEEPKPLKQSVDEDDDIPFNVGSDDDDGDDYFAKLVNED